MTVRILTRILQICRAQTSLIQRRLTEFLFPELNVIDEADTMQTADRASAMDAAEEEPRNGTF